MIWRITVLTYDGQTILAQYTAEDRKETQCICTIERSRDLRTQIWINEPSEPGYYWD